MTTDTKNLAEFAAEFLGFKRTDAFGYYIPHLDETWYSNVEDGTFASLFFNGDEDAAILAHLALREIEKKYFIQYATFLDGMNKIIHRWVLTPYVPEAPILGGEAQNENTFVALWTAIQEAVGK